MGLSNKLIEYRIKYQLTQIELAEKLGVSKDKINDWELNGNLPESKDLINISKSLDIPIDDLMFDNNSNKDIVEVDKKNNEIIKKEEIEEYDFNDNFIKFEENIIVIDHNNKKVKALDEIFLIKLSSRSIKKPKYKLEGHNHRKYLNELVYDLAYYDNLLDAKKELDELKIAKDNYKIKYNSKVKLTSFGVKIVK